MCFILSLWLIESDWQARSFVVGFTEPFAQGISALSSYLPGRAEPFSENSLAAEQAELNRTRAHLQTVMRENAELRKLLNLKAPEEWHFVHARILARDPVTWKRRFRINRGELDGLALGQAVVQGALLLGRVTELENRTALVTTILDPSCKVSVVVDGNGAVGILNGRINAGDPTACLVTFLPLEKKYLSGMRVSTSGLGETMPAGLEVGRLLVPDQIEKANLYKELQILPAADFSHSAFVSVLVYE